MLMIEYRSFSWWYWLATAILLSLGLSGPSLAYLLAICLTAIQLIHFSLHENSLTAFPLQVRVGYFLLLIIAFPGPMQWLYWLPCIGTWAQIFFGYCLMARLVSLLPWNSNQPISMEHIIKTLLAPPVRGNVLQGLPPQGKALL